MSEVNDVTQLPPAVADRVLRYAAFTYRGSGGNPAGVLLDAADPATLTSVPTHTRPTETEELDRALSALHWQPSDLDPRYPAHVAYGGNEHLVLAVREGSLLAALDYDYSSLDAQAGSSSTCAPTMTALTSRAPQLRSRTIGPDLNGLADGPFRFYLA